ncbi:MAG: FtsH protease activity modulator HflK [Desulfobacterales bacterium]|jgi:membrane protease subunit HflK
MSWDWEKLKQQQQSRGPTPPQMDEVVKNLKKIKLPGGPLAFVLLFVILGIYTSVYKIDTEEVGVVQRFGKYTKSTQPGLNFKLPFGIETVTPVPVRRILKEEFGFASQRNSGRSRTSFTTENSNEALMLTGDLNVAVVPWIVQYRVNDPYNFLFKVQDVKRLLRDMSEASMRLVVGDRSINEVLTRREEMADAAKVILQEELDNSEAGITISTIEMKRTNVPGPVQDSFNEVNQATQEKERTIYQAREEYNKAIPTARGDAERVVKAAEGYALDRVNRAKGDADRFKSVYAEYSKAKDVTARRLYLETLKDLLPRMGPKYIIDDNQSNLLPLLNLDQKNIKNLTGSPNEQ